MKLDRNSKRAAPEALEWATRLAARLRVIQASFNDQSPEVRSGFLLEEIQRETKAVPESDRGEFLDALSLLFPTVDTAPPPPPPPEKPAPLSTVGLVDALIEKFQGATAEERSLIHDRLRAAGLLVTVSEPPTIPAELRGKLGLRPEEPLDPERYRKLFVTLAELVLTLDHVIWSIWRKLAPKSALKRESTDQFRMLLGRYLQGDREVASYQIAQFLERTRQLTVALVSGFGSAGEAFARWYLSSYAPQKIRSSVETGSYGFLANVEQRCWRRYVELAEGLNGPLIEEQLANGVVSYVEELTAKPDTRKS
ncbi:MAG: hypothetical protein JO015_16170 [Verrucomicrobia bacterium]|nr:hypothetical protein [Verrucomicrobiota bacterium]